MSAVDSPSTNNNHHHQTHQLFDRKRKLEDYDSSESNGSGSRHRKTTVTTTGLNSKGKNVIDAAAASGESSRVTDDHLTAEMTAEEGEVEVEEEEITQRLQLQFFVKLINGGKTLVLRAGFGDTVEMVHKKIETATGIPMAEQRLIYRGRQLQWQRTLEECGVSNDDGMQLVARMRSTYNPEAWRVISDMVNVICCVCRNEIPVIDSRMTDARMIKVKLEQFMALPFNQSDEFSKLCDRVGRRIGNKRDDEDDDDDDDDEENGGGQEYEDEVLYNGGGGRGRGRDGRGKSEISKTDYYKVFMEACAPQALVMMYKSPEKRNRDVAEECIKWYVSFVKNMVGNRSERVYFATTVLEFCRLLAIPVSGKGGCYERDELYEHCRSTFGSMLGKVEVRRDMGDYGLTTTGEISFIAVQDVFPFLIEVGKSLVMQLESIVEPNPNPHLLIRYVCDFSSFLQPMLSLIGDEIAAVAAIPKGKGKGKAKFSPLRDEVDRISLLFTDLLSAIGKRLNRVEQVLAINRKVDVIISRSGWPEYYAILKELSGFAARNPEFGERFSETMRKRKVALRALVVRYASRADNHGWLLNLKDILDFDSRRHLAMLMFPEVREDYEELHEMLIDRSQLLAESFEYISAAAPSSLHAGLFMEFKNEEATGPGVLREWFCLVTQAIFDPQNALFVACPLDRRRFYPNPASKVDPLHLRYFRFAGRVIALALMHKIQVGVVLDRVFFLRLADLSVSVEDIKDADPCIYSSCKQILEMDPEFVDSDALGLTFVTELEELGSRKILELCPGGKGLVVNSKNCKEYVRLLVQHRFVKSVIDQVASFALGFADILRDGKLRATFFQSLESEDLDWMLHGSGSDISVEDWKVHTEYNGYKISDPQIVWFWEVVGELNAEQKKTLLFFWTSVKYLPIDGFHGLASRLFLYKSLEPQDHLPSSHTCFYRLCIPPYSSKAIMLDRLRVITQDHVGCSFGTW